MAELGWSQRSTLAALTTQYAVTGKQHFADLAKRLVDGLNKLALWDDGMAYFPLEAALVGRRESLSLEVNGRRTPIRPSQAWLALPSTKQGDEAVLCFELRERDESVHIGYDTYEVKYRGDTVTAISPPGKYCPLYERQWIGSPPARFPDPSVPGAPEIDSI